MTIEATLGLAVAKGASDVHLTAGNPPAFRVHGQLQIDEGMEPIPGEVLTKDLERFLDERQREEFRKELELDFALEVSGLGRFRGSAAIERGNLSLVFRRITNQVPDLDDLGLPPVLKLLALKRRGLVIVTGSVGSGKSTTLAAMIEHLNTIASRRIVTMEDPIEYLFTNKKSVITQRQVGKDTHSFMAALTHVLRHDPDVIMVGETRDAETVAATLTASETGHLVLTTAHAPGAPETINRIIDMFPPHHQAQIRAQLASILEGVFYQQLIPKADGTGRVAAVEILLGTHAIRNLIREGKTHQLYSAIQLAGNQGMQTLDQALLKLCKRGLITQEEGVAHAQEREQFMRDLQGARPVAKEEQASSSKDQPLQPAPVLDDALGRRWTGPRGAQ